MLQARVQGEAAELVALEVRQEATEALVATEEVR
jgi:hypothetical protein